MTCTVAETVAFVFVAIGSTCIVMYRGMRAKCIEARETGYLDGREDERALLRRELGQQCEAIAFRETIVLPKSKLPARPPKQPR
ncbi:MAG: hypothetical protein ABMA13_16095 [Chthoniobacteraceae bacterium]